MSEGRLRETQSAIENAQNELRHVHQRQLLPARPGRRIHDQNRRAPKEILADLLGVSQWDDVSRRRCRTAQTGRKYAAPARRTVTEIEDELTEQDEREALLLALKPTRNALKRNSMHRKRC